MSIIVENKQLNKNKQFYLPMSRVLYNHIPLLSVDFYL